VRHRSFEKVHISKLKEIVMLDRVDWSYWVAGFPARGGIGPAVAVPDFFHGADEDSAAQFTLVTGEVALVFGRRLEFEKLLKEVLLWHERPSA
jgi:hypothetical protein